MANTGPGWHVGRLVLDKPTLIIAVLFFMPVALPSLLGWLNGLLAVPVFFLLLREDNVQRANIQIRHGLFLAAIGALLINHLMLIVFSLTMLPLGYSFYRSVRRNDDPVTTGAKGIVNLALSWLIFWTVYGVIVGSNPYTSLQTMLDTTLNQVLTIYQSSTDLPADVSYNLKQIIETIQGLVPKILPGLLVSSILVTVWLNLVVSVRILRQFRPATLTWPRYKKWQLPDQLVWLAIAAVVLSIVDNAALNNIGYSLAIVVLMLYLFQGLAIMVHFFDRFNVPAFLRIILYALLTLQSYGLLLLSLIGLADVWLNIRKLEHNT